MGNYRPTIPIDSHQLAERRNGWLLCGVGLAGRHHRTSSFRGYPPMFIYE